MIRVAALTGGRDQPSARFRVRQYIAPLRELGVEVSEYRSMIPRNARLPTALGGRRERYALPARAALHGARILGRLPGVLASHAAQATWLNKELIRGHSTLERFCRRPVVLDVDDALWLKRPAIASLAAAVDVVFAGNSYIAEWFAQHCRRVEVVPTAIDTGRFTPDVHGPDRFVIGWTGSADNLPYLEALDAPLGLFLERHREAELLVICDREPVFRSVPAARVRFVPWQPALEASALNQMTVGLMPLPDTPWTRGKCSFKMLQYMAAGLPVVVSPVGMNSEVLALGEVGFAAAVDDSWLEALEELHADEQLRDRMGRAGRETVVEHFSVRAVAPRISALFRECIS